MLGLEHRARDGFIITAQPVVFATPSGTALSMDLSLKSSYAFELPNELIAQRPSPDRADCRLLVLSRLTGEIADRQFRELPDLLESGDLLVSNDTKVIPARLFGHKASGGRVEILIERVEGQRAQAMVRSSRSPRVGTELVVGGSTITVVNRGAFFELETNGDWHALMEKHGHIPLPPYIEREDEASDAEDYQTVFAERPGAVAAPTAGLHFDDDVLAELTSRGVNQSRVTLHVGAGTFAPMRVESVDEHQMHSEWFEVPPPTAAAVNETRARGKRVVAVGTTSVRALESSVENGTLAAGRGETDIFIRPGQGRFDVVNALITNFHLPESTLIMLVAAFAGFEPVMRAYRHAVAERYRFFSYGDAMLIL